MYVISGLAFLIYISKFPERFWSGKWSFVYYSHNKSVLYYC